MPETPGRYGQVAPAINSWVPLFTVPPSPATMIYGVDVCNGGTEDAHISIWVVPEEVEWASGEPPLYTRVVANQRIEADGTDGNVWVMPIKHLNFDDVVVVYTDKPGVTFYGHGFLYTA